MATASASVTLGKAEEQDQQSPEPEREVLRDGSDLIASSISGSALAKFLVIRFNPIPSMT